MTHHVLYGSAVFASAVMAQALWAGHPSQLAEHPSQTASVTSTAVTSTAAVTSARSGGYPYANAVCEFGRAGGAYCANPRNRGDLYDWGYRKGRSFRASDQWGYEYRNCTSYVAWRLARAHVPASLFSGLGDASDWIAGVRGERGVIVSNRPSPGAVATWDLAGVGHVAWVVSVRGSRVTVADYNYAGTGAFAQHAIGSPRPTAYIHFPARLRARKRLVADNSNKPRGPASLGLGGEMGGARLFVMARMDLKVQAWGWFTRRQASVAGLTDAQVIAMQRRQLPDNAVVGWLLGARVPGVSATDRVIPGPDGNDIPVRIYRPGNAAPGVHPVIVYFHGGGFSFGNLRMGDWLCSSAALRVGAVVVSVDYRLAPTHVFPAAVEDSYAALVWAAENAVRLGAGKGGAIGVAGESAGANLAAVASMLARDRGGPVVGHQALLYPPTDMRDTAAASEADPRAPFLSAEELLTFRRLYLGPDGDPDDPKASPLLAASQAGLPPTLIQVAEHDPLKHDGIRYAVALKAAGVPVRLTEYVGMPHGFANFPGLCRPAHQALSELCAEQREALGAGNAKAA